MKKKTWIVLCLGLILLDQVIKVLIRKSLAYGETWTIFPHFFALTYVKNQGGAFSLFKELPFLFILFSFLVCLFLFHYLWREHTAFWKTFFLTFVLGGALSNLLDRILLNGVTDYFSFTIFDYAFPIFNCADMFVVVGLFLSIILECWREKHGSKSH